MGLITFSSAQCQNVKQIMFIYTAHTLFHRCESQYLHTALKSGLHMIIQIIRGKKYCLYWKVFYFLNDSTKSDKVLSTAYMPWP